MNKRQVTWLIVTAIVFLIGGLIGGQFWKLPVFKADDGGGNDPNWIKSTVFNPASKIVKVSRVGIKERQLKNRYVCPAGWRVTEEAWNHGYGWKGDGLALYQRDISSQRFDVMGSLPGPMEPIAIDPRKVSLGFFIEYVIEDKTDHSVFPPLDLKLAKLITLDSMGMVVNRYFAGGYKDSDLIGDLRDLGPTTDDRIISFVICQKDGINTD